MTPVSQTCPLALFLLVPLLLPSSAVLAQVPPERGPRLHMTQDASTWEKYVVSDDGSTAAAASVGAGLTQITNLTSGRALAFIPAHGPTALSADGATAIVGGARGQLHMHTAVPLATDLSGCATGLSELKSVALSGDGFTSYVVDSQGKGRACDLATGGMRWNATLPWVPQHLRISADGKRLLAVRDHAWPASAPQLGDSALLDAATGQFLARFDHEGGNPVIDGALSNDGSKAYTIRDWTRGVAVWEAGAGNASRDLKHAAPGRRIRILGADLDVTLMALSPKGDRIAVADPPTIYMLDTVSGKILWNVEAAIDFQYVKKLHFVDKGAKLWAGTPGRSPVILDAVTGQASSGYPTAANVPARVDGVAVSDDGAIVAGWGRHHLSIWNAKKGKAIISLGNGDSALHLAKIPLPASPYGRCLPPKAVISANGAFAVADLCDAIYLIDLNAVTHQKLFAKREDQPSWIGPGVFSHDGGTLALATSEGPDDTALLLWKQPFNSAPTKIAMPGRAITSLGFTRDRARLWVVTVPGLSLSPDVDKRPSVVLVSLADATSSIHYLACSRYPDQCRPENISVSPNGGFVAFRQQGTNMLAHLGSSTPAADIGPSELSPRAMAFSCDERFLVTGHRDHLWQVVDTEVLSTRPIRMTDIGRVFKGDRTLAATITCDNQLLVLVDGEISRIGLHDRAAAPLLYRTQFDKIGSCCAAPHAGMLAAGSNLGIELFDGSSGRHQGTLITLRNGGTVTVAPSGHFDTDDFDSIGALNWAVPQQLGAALPLEAYSRNFFQPRLLSKLAGAASARLPAQDGITGLDVRQPLVQIERIRWAENQTAEVSVSVHADCRPGRTGQRNCAFPHDLRLFRDGVLAAQWPEPAPGQDEAPDTPSWLAATAVPMAPGQTRAEHTFRVALASHARGKPVEWTAYAFNEDRVKTKTASAAQTLVPEDLPLRPRKAYVITIGVDRHDRAEFDLSFAAKDARDLGAALSRIKGYEVVRLSLLSEHGKPDAVAIRQASKENIRSVLNVLAGNSAPARARLMAVAGIDRRAVGQLQKATPDDMVVIAFSGHGYTVPASGMFYLIPADSGSTAGVGPDVLTRWVSSRELSRWLRPIDAGQMALIIDACHAAGSVDDPAFRPGPMGDAGLGQLAYDKGMLILAATQASDVALEMKSIRQGLLTYALVNDGLQARPAPASMRQADHDRDGVLTLREWLRYGEQRVPELYEQIRFGKVKLWRRDPLPADANSRAAIADSAQTPVLFDFRRTLDSAVIRDRER